MSAASEENAFEPVVPGQDVHRHRHHLEPQEQDDEVLCPAQEHHAGRGQENQGIVLGRQQPLALHVSEGKQDGRAGREQRDPRGRVTERIERHHLGQSVRHDAVDPERGQSGGAQQHAGEAQPSGEPAVFGRVVAPAHDQEDHERPGREDHLRQEGQGDTPGGAQIETVHRRPSAPLAGAPPTAAPSLTPASGTGRGAVASR